MQLDCRDVLESRPPAEHGVVVCNPPYGVRLDDQDRLAELYPRLGDWLKQHWSGWNAFFFTADLRLAKLIACRPAGARPCSMARWSAGCLPTRWWPAATAKRKRR